MSKAETAYAWLLVIFSIAIVMLLWGALYDVVNNVFYSMAISWGAPASLMDQILMFWNYFPIPFLFGEVIWAISVSMRDTSNASGV